jgi:hypothetical protein
MKYIGRYRKDVDFQILVGSYPVLSNAQHLPYVFMFIFDTDDSGFITLLENDSRILHIEEDTITGHVNDTEYTDGFPIEVIEQAPSPSQEFTRTTSEEGNTVDSSLIDGFGSSYYWPLEHLMKRDFTLGSNATYHSYSYTKTGANVDVYIVDTGTSHYHPFLFDSAGNTRVNGLPGYGFEGVTGVKITNGGSGYTSAPTVVFSGGGGSSAAGTAYLSSGTVEYVRITNFGSGYSSAPTVSFTGGGGSSATATATINGDDDQSHGTYCAQCVGGDGHAGIYSSGSGGQGPGVAKECKFYGVKVLLNINGSGSGYTSDIVAGINAVIAHNDSANGNYKGSTRPSVINFSIGHGVPNTGATYFYDDETGSWASTLGEDALKTATAPISGTIQPVHVIQASGNGYTAAGGAEFRGPMQARTNFGMIARTQAESSNTDAGQGNPICVGATEEYGASASGLLKPAYFSNYGSSSLSIWAPGKGVPVGHWDWTLNSISTVALINGTSFSSPYTAGLVALRLEDKPTELPADTKAWLINTTTGGSNPSSINTLMIPTPLTTNPISVTASSSTVSVNWVGHNLTTGNLVQINGSTDVQGLLAANVNDWATVTVVDVDNFTYTAGANAVGTGTGGGSSVQACKVTGTFEATDGVYDRGHTLSRNYDGGSDNFDYYPVDYSDNKFFYSPYQDYTVGWTTAAGSLGTVTVGNSINYDLSAQISSHTTESPLPVTYGINSLPSGTSFNVNTGALTGNPSLGGTFNFIITADNIYKQETRSYSLAVAGIDFSMSGGIMLTGGITINT